MQKRVSYNLKTISYIGLYLLVIIILSKRHLNWFIGDFEFILALISIVIGIQIVFINESISLIFLRKYPDYIPVWTVSYKNNVNYFIWTFFIISACILEEIIFRFIAYKFIYINVGNELGACLITSLLFSVFHLKVRNVIQLFIIGLAFQLIFLFTSNLTYPIIAHIFHNYFIYLDSFKKENY